MIICDDTYLRIVFLNVIVTAIVFLILLIKGTLKEIEELKLSVAKLKLPYEHTPRI